MNTRGLTELVILNIGRDLRASSGTHLFSMLVVMALVTTMMTGPLLRRAYPDRRVARDIAEAERAALSLEAVRIRVLVVAAGVEATRQRFELALAVIAGERPAEIVVSSIEPFKTTRLEVGSGLSEELAAMTESMTSLEELVQKGAGEDVRVNVLTRFSGDVVADLLAQIEAMGPDLVIVGARDEAAQSVQSQAAAQVLVMAETWVANPPASVVQVAWGGEVDDDAAVVLGVRVASYRAIPLQLKTTGGASQRRFAALVARLSSNGVVMTDEVDEAEPRWRLGSVAQADVDLGVRAEPDPEPVDWAVVRPAEPRAGVDTRRSSGG